MEDFHRFFGSNAINVASDANAAAAAGPTTDVIAVSPSNNSTPETMGSINTRIVSGGNKQTDTLRKKLSSSCLIITMYYQLMQLHC